MIQHEIKPVYNRNSRILILGSFPSVKSREGGFFYHHPQNRFWKVLAALTDEPIPVSIKEKKELLLTHGIAVYDVIASCDIVGSSDSSIANVIPSNIEEILLHSSVKKIYVNGQKAYELYEKYQKKQTKIEAIKLPSTSPANAAKSLEALIQDWSVIRSEIYRPIKKLDQELSEALLNWFSHHARILPWREEPTPYRVWVSEIMLQQTRVEAVKPYYDRFMEVLPNIEALAKVDDEQLMKLWEGLGYYNRARNLKKAAQTLMERYQGEMPRNYEQILELSGIGEYTAGAISSIAYGIPVPAVDGNVLRVITRLTECYEDILKQKTKKEVAERLIEILPEGKSGDFNQALMELGAIVCVPNGDPKCEECPWDTRCLAHKKNLTNCIPVKKPKKERRKEEKTVFLLEYQGKTALHKRPEGGLLSALWEYPNTEGILTKKQMQQWMEKHQIKEYEILEELSGKHIFSHVEWHMKGIHIKIHKLYQSKNEKKPLLNDWIFVTEKELKQEYAIPAAFSWIKEK